MKKTKLKKDKRPVKRGFFEQKHVDIYRHGDMLVFQDTSGFIPAEPGDYVENLRYICFEDSSGNRAMVDILEGRTRKYQAHTTMPANNIEPGLRDEYEVHPHGAPQRPSTDIHIPYADGGQAITGPLLAYFAENVAQQVMQQDYNYSETLLNRIELLELKVRELEEREERRNWETGIST